MTWMQSTRELNLSRGKGGGKQFSRDRKSLYQLPATSSVEKIPPALGRCTLCESIDEVNHVTSPKGERRRDDI